MKNSCLLATRKSITSIFQISLFAILFFVTLSVNASNLPTSVESNPIPENTGDIIEILFSHGTEQNPVHSETEIVLTHNYSGYSILNPSNIKLEFTEESFCSACTGNVVVDPGNKQLIVTVSASPGQVISGSGALVAATGIVIEMDDLNTKKANPESLAISVYPNPAHHALHIKSQHIGSQLTMHSLKGEIVRKINLAAETTKVSISNLSAGIYIIKGIVNGHPVSKRIVVR